MDPAEYAHASRFLALAAGLSTSRDPSAPASSAAAAAGDEAGAGAGYEDRAALSGLENLCLLPDGEDAARQLRALARTGLLRGATQQQTLVSPPWPARDVRVAAAAVAGGTLLHYHALRSAPAARPGAAFAAAAGALSPSASRARCCASATLAALALCTSADRRSPWSPHVLPPRARHLSGGGCSLSASFVDDSGAYLRIAETAGALNSPALSPEGWGHFARLLCDAGPCARTGSTFDNLDLHGRCGCTALNFFNGETRGTRPPRMSAGRKATKSNSPGKGLQCQRGGRCDRKAHAGLPLERARGAGGGRSRRREGRRCVLCVCVTVRAHTCMLACSRLITPSYLTQRCRRALRRSLRAAR